MAPRTRGPPHPMGGAPRIKHKKFQPFSLKNGPSRAVLLLKTLKTQWKPLEKMAKKKSAKNKKISNSHMGNICKISKISN